MKLNSVYSLASILAPQLGWETNLPRIREAEIFHHNLYLEADTCVQEVEELLATRFNKQTHTIEAKHPFALIMSGGRNHIEQPNSGKLSPALWGEKRHLFNLEVLMDFNPPNRKKADVQVFMFGYLLGGRAETTSGKTIGVGAYSHSFLFDGTTDHKLDEEWKMHISKGEILDEVSQADRDPANEENNETFRHHIIRSCFRFVYDTTIANLPELQVSDGRSSYTILPTLTKEVGGVK